MNFESIKGSIAVLISGGVDSAVVVHLLCEAGLKPDLHYIRIGMDGEDSSCTAEEDIELSQATARKYGLKLEVTDLQKEYWEQVVGYTIERIKMGLTPNPDVMCNRLIKFGAFEQKVGCHYDYIATGHYATNVVRDGKMWLGTAKDPVKDQTDFLAQLSYEQLSHTLFPIGHLMKDEVRQIALDAKLPSAKRKDSQGICFLGKINYNDFLRRYLGEREGKIVELETGKILGKHQGYWFHTIGQRKGLFLSGGPWFVVKKDIAENVLYVSQGYDPATQYATSFNLDGFYYLSSDIFGDYGDYAGGHSRSIDVKFKIRHTPDFAQGHLSRLADGTYHIESDRRIQGVAAGQYCIIYDNDAHLVVASGMISEK